MGFCPFIYEHLLFKNGHPSALNNNPGAPLPAAGKIYIFTVL